MAITDKVTGILKNAWQQTKSLARTLQNRIDKEVVTNRGVLNYEKEALSKTSVEEAAGAYKALTGEGVLATGTEATQAAFQGTLESSRRISEILYDSTEMGYREAIAQPISRPANVITRQSGSRTPRRNIPRGKNGTYVQYESPTPIVESAPTVEETATSAIVANEPVKSETYNIVARPSGSRIRGWNKIKSNTSYHPASSGAQPDINPTQTALDNQAKARRARQGKGSRLEIDEAEARAYTEAQTAEPINVQNPATHSSSSSLRNNQQNGQTLVAGDEGSIDDLADSVRHDYQRQQALAKGRKENEKYWKSQPTEEEEIDDLYNTVTKKPSKFKPRNNNNENQWSGTMRAALGTAVGGAALMAALSGNRGQQNNAQLYGQQPLY